jgi:hypothetical protein
MTTLIGLMGPAGSGKTSVAQYLCDKYGAKKYSFAGQLKAMVGRALDFTDAQMYGTQSEKEAIDPRYGHSPRWFLQRIGTEGCRHTFGQDFWIEQCMAKIRRDMPDVAVLEDARFINEAEAIRCFHAHLSDVPQHGYVVKLLPPPGRETTEIGSLHPSETEWMQASADHTIAPLDRGLNLLFGLVDDVCRNLKLFPVRRETSI